MLKKKLNEFRADTRGNIAIIAALAITALFGFVSLVAEYGVALSKKADNQRVADNAAYLAAIYYTANSSSSNALANATTIARNIASLNGIPASNVTVSLVQSPAAASSQALEVTISNAKTLILAPIAGGGSTLTSNARSYAQIGASVSACIVSLSPTSPIAISGAGTLNAPTCAIATNNTVNVTCGAHLNAQSVSYNTTAPVPGCSGAITTTPTLNNITKAAIVDPLTTNAGVTALEAHVPSVAAMTAPAAPVVTVPKPATTVSFTLGYNSATQTSGGCTATYSGTTWSVTCPAGTYNVTALSVGGSQSLNFNQGGPSTSIFDFNTAITTANTTNFGPGTYNFASAVTTAGTTTFAAGNYNFAGVLTVGGTSTFGAGTYKFAKGIVTQGGSTTTFGAGTYNIGNGTAACYNKGGTYSICDTSTLNFNGAGTYSISNGIYVGGGSTLNMGTGSSNNSYNIGPSSDGNAFKIGGSAIVTLGDSTGANGLFQVVGLVDASTGGSSCLTLPAATQHDINGSLLSAGGTVLGSGIYTINGDLALGANGGGSAYCASVGQTVGLRGINVTIVYSAVTTLVGNTCGGDGVCFAAGFGNVYLTAPTTGDYTGLLLIGPKNNSNSSALFTGGSGAVMSGVIYIPTGNFSLTGGASINDNANQCLQVVALTVTLSGGTTTASTCVTTGSAGSTTPTIVQ